jgi:hypothetical protein
MKLRGDLGRCHGFEKIHECGNFIERTFISEKITTSKDMKTAKPSAFSAGNIIYHGKKQTHGAYWHHIHIYVEFHIDRFVKGSFLFATTPSHYTSVRSSSPLFRSLSICQQKTNRIKLAFISHSH